MKNIEVSINEASVPETGSEDFDQFDRLLRKEQGTRANIDASGSTFSARSRVSRDEVHERSR